MAKDNKVVVTEDEEKKYIDELVARVSEAQKKFAEFTQEQVDYIFRRVSLKLSSLRIPLAEMAVKETGMGIVEDKVIKNHFASEYIYNKFKNVKTCGVVDEDKENGLIKLSNDEKILFDFNKRSKEIENEGFIEKKYAELANSMINSYLSIFHNAFMCQGKTFYILRKRNEF